MALSVGEILRREREKQGLTLKQVERAIRVRERFLNYIEANEWDHFSSRIYIEGIIKSYAKHLKVDAAKALAFFRRDFEKQDDVKFKRRVQKKYLTSPTRALGIFGILAVTGIFFLYFSYQLTMYLAPPRIQLLAPKETTFRKEKRVNVIGKTEKEATVMIYGERVYPSERGIFEYQFPLKPGKNILTIEVTGANGKKTVFTKEFFNQ